MHRKKGITRRQFVSGLGAATAGFIAGACSRGSNPLSNQDTAKNNASPFNPGQPQGAGHQSQVKITTAACADYNTDNLRAHIQKMVDELGGVGDIVSSGDTVGIKLNMTGGSGSADKCPGEYGEEAPELFWTHPEILRVVGELFKDAGAGKLVVMEAIYDQKSYYGYGYRDVVNYLGADFVNLNVVDPYPDFIELEVPGPLGHYDHYYHNRALHELDCFVSLPKAKRHYGAGVTHSMKNMVGSVPLLDSYTNGAGHRKALHANGNPTLVRNFLDINRVRPIHFAVNDAIKTAENGEGPWNDGFRPVRHDKLVAGKDPVAVDSVSTQIIGWDPMSADFEGPFAGGSLPGRFDGTDNYLRIAEENGMGIHDLNKIQVVDATASTLVEEVGV